MLFFLLYFGPVLVLTVCSIGLILFFGTFAAKLFRGASNKDAAGSAARFSLKWTAIGITGSLLVLVMLAAGAGA